MVSRARLLALALLFLVAAGVLAELGLRAWARGTHRERGMVFDAELGWRMAPGIEKTGAQWDTGTGEPARTNSLGWREEEFAPSPAPGVRRLVTLGDSFTFGVGVPRRQRFTELVEAARPSWEVLNLGCNAYGTDQELRVLETHGVRYEPDVVLLVVYLGNDLDDITLARNGHWPKPWYRLDEEGLGLVPAEASWDVLLRGRSYLGEAVFRLVGGVLPSRVRAPSWREGDPLPLFRALVLRMQEVSHGAGARFLAALVYASQRVGLPRLPREVRARHLLEEAGVEVLDTHGAFARAASEESSLHLPDTHWSPAGHRLVARLVVERLDALGWMD